MAGSSQDGDSTHSQHDNSSSRQDDRQITPSPQPIANGASRWVVLFAAAAIMFVGVGMANSFGVFQTYYQTSVFPNEPTDKLIIIGSLASSMYLILGALTGPFADYVGYQTGVAVGSVLMIGSLFAANFATKFWHYLLSQGVGFGLGLAFAYAPATSISRQYFESEEHGLASAIVISGGSLGGCIFPYTVKYLISHYGLPQAFRILGYVAAGVLLPSSVFLKPKESRTGALPTKIFDFSLLKDIRFIGLLIACTIAMTGFLPRVYLLPLSAISSGVNTDYSFWLLGLMNGLSIVGRLGIGSVADRIDKVTALAMSFLLCGLGHIIFWVPGTTISPEDSGSTTALYTLFVVFVGLLGSGYISLFPVVVAQLFGKDKLASKTGLLNSILGISTLAGPSIIYRIIGEGVESKWMIGVLTSGAFMMGGGVFLLGWLKINNVAQHARS